MNLRDLEYAIAVAERCSFSAAAEHCNVSQPALSNQIKKLEQELGTELFHRQSGGVRTTSSGQQIITIAQEVLRGAQKIKDTAAEYRDPEAVPFNIGLTPTLAPYLTEYFSDLFRKLFPRMRVTMIEDLPGNTLQMVEDRVIDVALVAKLNHRPSLDFTSLWKEPLYLGLRKGHPLESLSSIDAEEVPVHDFVRVPHSFGYELEARLPPAVPEARSAKKFDITALRFETICRHVCHSDDCTLVSALAAEQFRQDNWPLSFIPFDGPGNLRELGVASRPNCPRKPLLEKVIAYIYENPPKGVTPTFGA